MTLKENLEMPPVDSEKVVVDEVLDETYESKEYVAKSIGEVAKYTGSQIGRAMLKKDDPNIIYDLTRPKKYGEFVLEVGKFMGRNHTMMSKDFYYNDEYLEKNFSKLKGLIMISAYNTYGSAKWVKRTTTKKE